MNGAAPTLFDDLFIPDRAQQVARGLTCLRDACPDALEVVARLDWWKPNNERGSHASGEWAYVVCRDGFHFGSRYGAEWRGWDRNPPHLLTWEQLRQILEVDPRQTDVAAWLHSQTAVDRWRDYYRPYELWPDPGSWHPSYIESDRERDGYHERMNAWRTTQDILTDAIRRIEGDLR